MRINMSEHVETGWEGGWVSECAYCMIAPNPSPLTNVGTNTWIISRPDSKSCVVVDPGPRDSGHVRRILAFCHAEEKRIAGILLTHMHLDHAPAAEELAAMTGAPIYSHVGGNAEEGKLSIPGFDMDIEVVALFGHSSDSVGYLVVGEGLFLTGDVMFAHSSTMVCWPDGSLGRYFASLDTIAALVEKGRVTRLLTGHGKTIDDPATRVAQCRRHRQKRLRQVVSAVRSGVPAKADRLVDVIYNDVDSSLLQAAERSVNAQLRYAFDVGLLEEHA